MKTLAVNRNIIVSIFVAILLTYSVQGITYGQEVPDDIVEFSDRRLAYAVRRALRLPTGDGVDLLKIPKAELERLTTLEANDRKINDLVGLEHASQLTTLYLGGNEISDLTPLAQLTQLEYLDLSVNDIIDVTPLLGLVSLKTLHLSGNPIEDASLFVAYLDANPNVDLDIAKYIIREEGGPTLTASTSQPLTGATLDDARVTLTLSSGIFVEFQSDIRNALTISGISGIGIKDWNTVARVSDTKIGISLWFTGDTITTDSILTLTLRPEAIRYYNGPALTAQIPVKGVTEAELAELSQAIVASTPYPLTEATLNGSIVTLRLTSGTLSVNDYDHISVSEIKGVTIAKRGTWSKKAIKRVSDTEMTVELRFSGSISTDTTLIFTAEPRAIYGYNGPPRTAEIPVSATTEVKPTGGLIASTSFPLTKTTLDDSFVVLTLQDDFYSFKDKFGDVEGSYFRPVGISGIRGVQAHHHESGKGVIRLSRSEILVRVDFQGDFNTDGTLTFTGPPSLIDNYDGPPLTAVLPVTVKTELRVLIPDLQQHWLYWINTDTRKIESVGPFDAVTQAVTGITVDRAGGKLYWGERGDNSGTIKRANLDGTNVEELVSLSSMPRGIAIDAVGNRLYWTNSDLQIQSANLNGEDIKIVIQLENEIVENTVKNCGPGFVFFFVPIVYSDCNTKIIRTNLTSPLDIAISTMDGRLYWTELSKRIRRVNLDGTNLEAPLSEIGGPSGIAVVDDKVYWAEEVDESFGEIRRSNLNGTNIETLATVQGLPTGLSVDTEASKVYWTNSLGGIQRMNLNGGEVESVVSGITAPGDFVLVPRAQSPTPTTATQLKSDVNGDGIVNIQDLVLTASSLGQTGQNKADVNSDGIINIQDLVLVAGTLGTNAAAPSLHAQSLEMLTAVEVRLWLSQARHLSLRDITSQRGVLFLEQLLAALIPKETLLLSNYPNPFNPETWIPYHLAKDADVTLTIYAVNGQVVRTLTLGHQPAGMYQSRSRAVYWDGRNTFGEPVASGVYFYTLTVGDFIATRKMLIRK